MTDRVNQISGKTDKPGLVLPWGWLSIGLAVVAIAALGTLAVVSKKQSADSLSTIALALAILSFSAQLIVTLAQSYNGSLQLAQADQVNADTKSSLAAIRATSDALLSNQRDQFGQVLHAALRSAVPAAVEDVSNADASKDGELSSAESEERVAALEDRLLVRLDEALKERSPRQVQVTPSPKNEKYRTLRTYPPEQRGKELLRILRNLTPQESIAFTKFVTSVTEQLGRGGPGRINLFNVGPSNGLHSLNEKGLIRLQRLEPAEGMANRYSVRLTELGEEVASLIVGSGPEPDWLGLTDDQLSPSSIPTE